MRDPFLPIAAKNQIYEFELAIGPTQEQASNIKVTFTGFPTLGHLIQCLHNLQSSNATQLAAAFLLAENDDEYRELLAQESAPDPELAERVLRKLDETDPFYQDEVIDDPGQLTLDGIPAQRTPTPNGDPG